MKKLIVGIVIGTCVLFAAGVTVSAKSANADGNGQKGQGQSQMKSQDCDGTCTAEEGLANQAINQVEREARQTENQEIREEKQANGECALTPEEQEAHQEVREERQANRVAGRGNHSRYNRSEEQQNSKTAMVHEATVA